MHAILLLAMLLAWKPTDSNLTWLINDYRSEWNAKPLVEDPHLTCAAKIHVDYIKSNASCTHVGPGGETVRDRSISCGYPWTYGEQFILCQYLNEDVWFNTLRVYPREYRILRDHAWNRIGVAENQLWWVLILAH